MLPTPLEFESYKEFLKAYIKLHKRPGLVSELAQGAACDRTYLSQVLSSKVQFTPDHGLALSEYLRMSDSEQNFFLLLILKERATNPSAKKILKKKMEQIVSESLILAKRIKSAQPTDELSDDEKNRYYATWQMAGAHILTSVKGGQSVEAIAERLKIDPKLATEIMTDLLDMKLVTLTSRGYAHSGKNIHTSRGSPHTILNHMHWRNKALEQVNSEDSIHFTNVFAISKKDWPALKSKLLEFIEQQRGAIHKSGSEDLFCFCCDLYSP